MITQQKLSEIFKSIRNEKYPSFTSYIQKQVENQNQFQYKLEPKKKNNQILYKQDLEDQIPQPQLVRDYFFEPPVIERVTSKIIEDSVIHQSEIMQDQKLKMQQQKELIIKKKYEMNKSEQLKFEEDKKQGPLNQVVYFLKNFLDTILGEVINTM
ncbi:unnamed protein product [Paramecium primaurelia]|uniref:Uncharacterized protein n=1 Tax=Paramecium primaurelia TaxID=5886 RepID=A0A8S1N6P7_PARPR|nr:unnamed protein product [Paramecium primaurelia]